MNSQIIYRRALRSPRTRSWPSILMMLVVCQALVLTLSTARAQPPVLRSLHGLWSDDWDNSEITISTHGKRVLAVITRENKPHSWKSAELKAVGDSITLDFYSDRTGTTRDSRAGTLSAKLEKDATILRFANGAAFTLKLRHAPKLETATPPKFETAKPPKFMKGKPLQGVTVPAPTQPLAGQGGFDGVIADPSVPAKAKAKLKEYRSKLSSVAFTKDGGFGIIYEDGYWCEGVPDEAWNSIVKSANEGRKQITLGITPEGGFSLMLDNTYVNRDIPDEAERMIMTNIRQGTIPRSLTFSPSGGWTLINRHNGFFNRNTPEGLNEEMTRRVKAGHKLETVVYTPNGRWYIIDKPPTAVSPPPIVRRDPPPAPAAPLNNATVTQLPLNGVLRTNEPMISVNGKYGLVVRPTGAVDIFDTQTNEIVRSWPADPNPLPGKTDYFLFRHSGPKMFLYRGTKYGSPIVRRIGSDTGLGDKYSCQVSNTGDVEFVDNSGNVLWADRTRLPKDGVLRTGWALSSANGRYSLTVRGNGQIDLLDNNSNRAIRSWDADPNPIPGETDYFLFRHSGPKMFLYRGTKSGSPIVRRIGSAINIGDKYSCVVSDSGDLQFVDTDGNVLWPDDCAHDPGSPPLPASLPARVLMDLAVRATDKPTAPTVSGYERIRGDLNKGAGGKFIWLYAKFGSGTPVTDIRFIVGKASRPTPGYTKIDRDLNEGAGGKFIYMEYTKDPSKGDPITDVRITVDEKLEKAGLTPVDTENGYWERPYNDLNQGAGGPFIFLSFQRWRDVNSFHNYRRNVVYRAALGTLDLANQYEGRLISRFSDGSARYEKTDGPADDCIRRKLFPFSKGQVKVSQYFKLGPHNISFFVASDEKTIIVAFRGTDSGDQANLLMNGQANEFSGKLKTQAIANGFPDRYSSLKAGGIVGHQGWLRGSLSILPTIIAELRARGSSRKTVILTGHSMGGVMAHYVTWRLLDDPSTAHLLQSRTRPHRLVTFGAPNAGIQLQAGFGKSFHAKLLKLTTLHAPYFGIYRVFTHGDDGDDAITRIWEDVTKDKTIGKLYSWNNFGVPIRYDYPGLGNSGYEIHDAGLYMAKAEEQKDQQLPRPNGWVEFNQQGAYVADLRLAYDLDGEKKTWSSHTTVLKLRFHEIPGRATNVRVEAKAFNGFRWPFIDPKYQFDGPPNRQFESSGTSLQPRFKPTN